MYSNDKISIDTKPQAETLGKLTRFFLDRDFTQYYEILSACLLNANEMAKRQDFYIKLSKILSRHLRIVPDLAEARDEFKYIARDMVDTGTPELMGSGSALLKACSKKATASSIVSFPEFDGASADEFLKKYSGNIKALLLDEMDSGWELSGDVDRNLAFLCELTSFEDSTAAGYAEKWFNAEVGWSHILTIFFEDICELLRAKGESGWLITLGELAIPFINESPVLYSVLSEAHFMLSSFGRSLELIASVESSVSITPYLKHLKSYALWRTRRSRMALELIRERLLDDRKDVTAALLAGDILLEASKLEAAVKACSYAYNIEPDSPDVVFALARAYRECYLFGQVDVCMDKLGAMNNAGIKKYKLGAEVYVKCDREGARVFIDGKEAGTCPLLLKRVAAGRHDLKWLFPDGSETGFEADLKDGYIQKFKYISGENIVDVEASRDGLMTLYRADKTITLPELLKDFMVLRLEDLPLVGRDDFISEEIMSGILDDPETRI